MLIISRIILVLISIPTTVLLAQGLVLSTLNLIAFEQRDSSILLIAICCYLGLIGFLGLIRLTFTRQLNRIGERYVYLSLASGIASVTLLMNFSSFALIAILYSAILLLLTAYAFWRWHINKQLQSDALPRA